MRVDKCLIIILAGFLLYGCAAPRGVYHTVQKGQTVYQIARSYQVEPEYLIRINRISDPARLAIGERLFIPGATRSVFVPATVTATKPPDPVVPSPVPSRPPEPKPAVRKPAPAQPSKRTVHADTRPAPRKEVSSTTLGKGSFHWPVKGEVIKKFSPGSGSKASNGIEIATRAGSGVLSSAAGKVIYSGNGIAGYGNLVIIEHDESFYSVYGFNQKNLVETGSFVSQGQKIALSGIPPSGGVPRLYFEIRNGKVPRDPIFYLP